MHLLYLTFGNKLTNHLQAAFSIYSFLQQPGELSSINIITDAASFYQHLSGQVNIIDINAEKLREWKGPYEFFWRVKIKAIETISHKYPGDPVMYIDTDTFLYTPISQLKQVLQKGQALMHENEGAISTLPDHTVKKMWRHINGKSYGGLRMQATDCMWNAGVVASPNTLAGKEWQQALQICDEMCGDGVPVRLIEQYALALSLHHNYSLTAAQPFIAHYWSNKEEWDEYIMQWLTEWQLKQLSLKQRVDAFATIDMNKVPIIKRKRTWAKRLHTFVDNLLPARNITFLQKGNN